MSDASRPLLTDWYAALRVELRSVIDELTPTVSDQTTLDGAPKVERPGVTRRRELVELGAKIVTALGSEVDPPAPPAPRAAGGAPRIRKGDV